MKISLLTDAPYHNLALMKLSAFHKQAGDEIMLNMPLWKADYRYASWLFDDGVKFEAEETGGIGFNPKIELPKEIEKLKPDYDLFNLDHSLGYTFKTCFRKCRFCKVPFLKQDTTHHSIWEFHDSKFDTIELLNNNIFYDPLWEETFKEIYEADLKIKEHGFDLRLLDERKAWWIKRLKWKTRPKFAWDRLQEEKKIIEGIKLLKDQNIKEVIIYVLMGFDSSFEENIYRCEVIHSFGYDPWPMLYRPTKLLRKFRRFIYLRYYRQYKTIAEAWEQYQKADRK